MNVELDANTQRDLELLAQAEGKEPGVLLRELLHEAITERKRNGAKSEEADLREQEVGWGKLLAELDALPDVEPRDGQCASRDHDKILLK